MKRFALIGAGGYIAPRHLKAIKDTDNVLVAALDKSDSVGVLDTFFPEASFFTEFERFDRHLEKLRRRPDGSVDYVSICSPNYLHDAHVRFALRIEADAICEKPIAINPWNVDALEELVAETGQDVYAILQLRLHPEIAALKQRVENADPSEVFDVDLTYITPRGRWYMASWKGDLQKSGGVATNIGVHFFDMLQWIFGAVERNVVHLAEPTRMAGFLGLKRARVRWLLSVDGDDLAQVDASREWRTYRSIIVNGQEVEFSEGFTDLHTESYRKILAGDGFTLTDAKGAVEIVSTIRQATPLGLKGEYHPLLRRGRGQVPMATGLRV